MANLIAFSLLALVLIVAAITDCKHGKIYNKLTLPAILIGLLFWLIAGLSGSERGITDSLFGFACGLVPFAMIMMFGGLGGGDVKLMAAVGALSASWQCVLSTAFYGLILAMVMALIIMVHAGVVKQTFARIWGAILMTSVRVRPDLENNEHKVPFGAAVAVGGLLAGAEQMLGLVTPWAALSP